MLGVIVCRDITREKVGYVAKDKIVIGLTGMPGSGKSTIVQIARCLGYSAVIMGDFIREEAHKHQLQTTAENMGWLMFKLRKEKGEAVVAELTVEAVKTMDSPVVVIDGIRSQKEIVIFREVFKKFRLFAVLSPAKKRFERLRRRLRSDDPAAWRKFEERDYNETVVGVPEAVSKADMIIENVGSLESFELKVKNILEDTVNDLSNDNYR